MTYPKINLFWFRRDLRLNDNHGLFMALNAGLPVLPIFIFDTHILAKLPKPHDLRVQFIHQTLAGLNDRLKAFNSSLLVFHDTPDAAFNYLLKHYNIDSVYCNDDYEPYAIKRDSKVETLLSKYGARLLRFKDQVIFEKDEVLSLAGKPFKIYTPYKREWLKKFKTMELPNFNSETLLTRLVQEEHTLPALQSLGFKAQHSNYPSQNIDTNIIAQYHETRDFPGIKGTSRLGIHLRFGTISIREVVQVASQINETYLNELIWREFFMMLIYHHPESVSEPFHKIYRNFSWINDEDQFRAWCEGRTGYAIVDAGMRELNETGFMHNRVRMIAASFLAKHLLIDWRWGEAYFAEKLLDYDQASNVGNWQWAAGTGADAQPYFRVFNPMAQATRFDKDLSYIKKWVPEYGSNSYQIPIVDHTFARKRAIDTFMRYLHVNKN